MGNEPLREAPCGRKAARDHSSYCRFLYGWWCACGWRARADDEEGAWRLLVKAHEVKAEALAALYGSVEKDRERDWEKENR